MFSDGNIITLTSNDNYYVSLDAGSSAIVLTADPSSTVLNQWTVNLISSTIGFQLTTEANNSVYYLNADTMGSTLTATTDSSLTGTHFIFAQDPQSAPDVGLLIGLTQNGSNRFLCSIGEGATAQLAPYPPLSTPSKFLFTVAPPVS